MKQRHYHWDTGAFLDMDWNIEYILTSAKDKSGSGPALQSCPALKKWRWKMTIFAGKTHYIVPWSNVNIDHFLPNFYINPVETT